MFQSSRHIALFMNFLINLKLFPFLQKNLISVYFDKKEELQIFGEFHKYM